MTERFSDRPPTLPLQMPIDEKMNETECSKLISNVGWTDVHSLVSLSILAVINVLVIVGNCLVIAAVFWSHKLRSVTNFFIVSLAVADLLVGIAVLPFSATWEVFKVSKRIQGAKGEQLVKQARHGHGHDDEWANGRDDPPGLYLLNYPAFGVGRSEL